MNRIPLSRLCLAWLRRTMGFTPWVLNRVLAITFVVAAAQFGAIALAGQNHTVIQKDRSFDVKELDIAAGDTVQFSNEDKFIHQIYVASGELSFDSAEQPPGEVISITFSNPGTYEIRCHIHPKMSLTVNAK